VPGAVGYRIRWRPADRSDWTAFRDVGGDQVIETLKGVIVDDHFVGVSALSKDGAESLVTFAGLQPRQ
jgi:hypothetical protein